VAGSSSGKLRLLEWLDSTQSLPGDLAIVLKSLFFVAMNAASANRPAVRVLHAYPGGAYASSWCTSGARTVRDD